MFFFPSICAAGTLYRSDFFPGLGWMLSKSIWDELSPKWPKAYPFIDVPISDSIVLTMFVSDLLVPSLT